MRTREIERKRRQAVRRLFVQPLEPRVVLAASMGWDGPGQGSAVLTYHIANHPSSLTQAETNQAIERALNAWSSVANIKFIRTNQPGLKDSLDFSFAKIDGVAKTLAQAYFPDDINSPQLAGDIQFDIDDYWEVGNKKGGRAFDLTYVAVHEIGHALGLEHSDAAGSVMAATTSPDIAFSGLSIADKQAILSLYASVDTISLSTISTLSSQSKTDGSESEFMGLDDCDKTHFPKERWRHGGQFERFGSRFQASPSFNHNVYQPRDVNGDTRVTPSDALNIINMLLKGRKTSLDLNNLALFDTNADGYVSPIDALIVINGLIQMRQNLVDGNGGSSTNNDNKGGSPNGDSTDDSNLIDDETIDDDDDDDDTIDDDTTFIDCDSHDPEPIDPPVVSPIDTRPGAPLRNGVVAWFNAEDFLSKFDTDSSGSLTDKEVPEYLWDALKSPSIDVNEDSIVTETELRTAIKVAREDLFNAFDTNRDGQLTCSEIVHQMLHSADTDRSGGLSFAEFDAHVSKHSNKSVLDIDRGKNDLPNPGTGSQAGSPNTPLRSAFLAWFNANEWITRFDADSSGSLTESEVPPFLWHLLEFSSFDANSDAAISESELQTAIKAAREDVFKLLDADDNGQLTSTDVIPPAWTILSTADTDSSGGVSLTEFDNYLSQDSKKRLLDFVLGRIHRPGTSGSNSGKLGTPEPWRLAADSFFAAINSGQMGILPAPTPLKLLDSTLGKSLDKNSDGQISSDELKAAISDARQRYFSFLDKNSDGQLTRSEVGDRGWRLISRADRDADGIVSRDEFKALKPDGQAAKGSEVGKSGNTARTGRLSGRSGRR